MFIYPNKPIRFYTPDRFIDKLKPEEWLIQPKWDGHRAIVVCNADGAVTVFSRHGTPLTLAKDNWKWLSMLKLPRPWVLDAELTRSNRMVVWDYAVMAGDDDTTEPYEFRLKRLQVLMPRAMKKNDFVIELIETLPIRQWREITAREGEEELEGFVLKRKDAVNLWGPYATNEVSSQFKFRFK